MNSSFKSCSTHLSIFNSMMVCQSYAYRTWGIQIHKPSHIEKPSTSFTYFLYNLTAIWFGYELLGLKVKINFYHFEMIIKCGHILFNLSIDLKWQKCYYSYFNSSLTQQNHGSLKFIWVLYKLEVSFYLLMHFGMTQNILNGQINVKLGQKCFKL